MLKKRVRFPGASCCFPHTEMTRGEWFESFLTEAATSIRPPLSSTDWETKNLSILDIAEDAPGRLLSKIGGASVFHDLLVVEVPPEDDMVRIEVCLAHLLPKLGSVGGVERRVDVDYG
ncbi:unnamed protein product [Sphagnum troendelagicum]|uniref:Uncharacterized protein n=1 Tax=Sphagnum troendelagicum TaxID=128251 RepID=A0ABP0UTX5_9BRYO